jgi:hypothetical protein
MSGRLSRPERRALQKQDEHFLRLPLDHGTDPRSMGAHLRQLVRLLTDPRSRTPVSDAVAHITRLYDKTVPPWDGLACRKGCSHCCTQPVSITAAEALYVASALKDRPDTAAAVIAADEAIRSLSPEELGRRYCPMLVDDACSIYVQRPLACRSFVSTSLEACIATFDHGAEPQIPMPAITVSLLYTHRMMLMAALRLVGADDSAYELKSAVSAVLKEPDAERRFLSGERVAAGAGPGERPPPDYDRAINERAAYVYPTL